MGVLAAVGGLGDCRGDGECFPEADCLVEGEDDGLVGGDGECLA